MATINPKTGKPRRRPKNFYLYVSGSPHHKDEFTGFGITGADSVDGRYWFTTSDHPSMRRMEYLFLDLNEKDARRLERELKGHTIGKVEYLNMPAAEAIGLVRGIIETSMPQHLEQFEAKVKARR